MLLKSDAINEKVVDSLLTRFLRYVKLDTQSDPESKTSPSTAKQFELAKMLKLELEDMGIVDVHLSNCCYLTGVLLSNSDKIKERVGIIAHLDTSPDAPGNGVSPQIIKSYNGKDIVLPKGDQQVIDVKECSELKACIGHTIITSDGTTLLGADNKAGVAIIMESIKFLLNNPQIKHGDIVVLFTPDEEVGRGTEKIDLKKFAVDFAYTVDGGLPPVINKETFSANSCEIKVKGRDIHPGAAKNIMINSLRAISEIISRLPIDVSPERTENREPFIHPHTLSATVVEANLKMILRDFEESGLLAQEKLIKNIIVDVEKKFPGVMIECEIKKSYRNMLSVVEKNNVVTDRLERAVRGAGLVPVWKPIRGGTDGAGLSAMGIPTPNIFTGGANFHSKREWASLDCMALSLKTVIGVLSVEDAN